MVRIVIIAFFGLFMFGKTLLAVEELPKPLEIEKSIKRGVQFLVDTQNENGSWGSASHTKGSNLYAPVPGAHHAFRTTVTAMAIMALIESGHADEPGPEAEALAKGQNYLLIELPNAKRASADAIYNVWAHAYGLQALALLHKRTDDLDLQSKISRIAVGQVRRLERFESVDGGWGYYDFNAQTARPSSSSLSFTTATILVAIKEAADVIEEVELSDRVIKRAILSINRQRNPDLSFMYGEYLKNRPRTSINRPAGSLGRTQACNYALRIWGDNTITDQHIVSWLDRLEKRNGWLDMARKRPVPHESWFAVAGYFYYYGHYYAAKCTEVLPAELATPRKQALASLIVPKQEKDGSWWDFPFYSYHQPYGTAFALMTLVRCRD